MSPKRLRSEMELCKEIDFCDILVQAMKSQMMKIWMTSKVQMYKKTRSIERDWFYN